MKTSMFKYLLTFLSMFLIGYDSFSQDNNFGFTSTKVPLTLQSSKLFTNMIATPIHVYYVAAYDSKIYDVVWDAPTLTWIPGSYPLGGAGCPAVKTGTNIVNYGEELFFVSAVDSKIYRLKWDPVNQWQGTIVNSVQVPVVGSRIFLKTLAHGCEIYYIGTGGKICKTTFNGSTWSTGAQVTTSQTMNAVSTSPLMVSATSVYYIGSTDNKIYRVYWNGSSWTGGSTALVAGSSAVRSLSNIVNENDDLDHLYYVNTSSQICELVLVSGSWTYNIISSGGNLVVSGTDIVCSYGSVFYARSTDRSLWRVWKTGTWNNERLYIGAMPIVANSQMFVWANDIIEEGTLNTTFKSFHVFYPTFYATSPTIYKIDLLVYDDKRVPFTSFGCWDECDNNNNGTGHDLPLPNTDATYYEGYDCSLYNVGGIKPKEWYKGMVPAATYGISAYHMMAVYNKRFFYVGGDSKIYDFGRSPMNKENKTGWGSPSWQDEFNGTSVNTTDWLLNDYVNAIYCYKFWNKPANATVSGGNLNIVGHNVSSSPSTLPYHGIQTQWKDPSSCYAQLPGYNATTQIYTIDEWFNYSSEIITTGDVGKPRVKYGYLESRLKIPRGKGLWPTFFFYTGGRNEDINFEFQSNGKSVMTTLYHPTDPWYGAIMTYAVGYRFYDDFYTYALDWPSNGGNINFYLNNEWIGARPNNVDNTGVMNCRSPHDVIYSLEIDPQVHALCEPEIFPANYKIDYFRSWGSTIVRSPLQANSYIKEGSENKFIVSPNPAQNIISIEGESFSKAEIYTIQGAKILESNTSTINIEKLSKGIYLVKIIILNGKEQTLKFIKK